MRKEKKSLLKNEKEHFIFSSIHRLKSELSIYNSSILGEHKLRKIPF